MNRGSRPKARRDLPGVADNAAGDGDRAGDGAGAVSDGQSGGLALLLVVCLLFQVISELPSTSVTV